MRWRRAAFGILVQVLRIGGNGPGTLAGLMAQQPQHPKPTQTAQPEQAGRPGRADKLARAQAAAGAARCFGPGQGLASAIGQCNRPVQSASAFGQSQIGAQLLIQKLPHLGAKRHIGVALGAGGQQGCGISAHAAVLQIGRSA